MSNEIARRNLETSLEGTLSDLVKASEVVMLLVDTSSSMCGSPIENLRKVVNEINPRANGIPMIAFGGPYDAQCRFVDSVPDPDGGTPLHMAIPMAKEYGANRVVVISDGYPDLPQQCDIEAKNFGGKIDVVFIGDAGDSGEFFLRNLANMTGGAFSINDVANTKELSGRVMLLLEGEVEAPRAPIQGPGFTTVDDDDVREAEEDDDSDDDDEDDDDDDADDDDDEDDDEN